ncbi:hypothetical protein [Lentzea sp. NPDC092896]|uniref:hypothetical protein n=1 Tax=Lentzea sp. NPDC092896 TaxID=3364127 RepID=UPI0038084061
MDLNAIWDSVWPNIVQYRSELIASLALIVSLLAARIAWRNARAAEIQAEAASVQAQAALDQAREAQHSSALSYTAYEVQALEAARARIDAILPQVVVVADLLSEHPIVIDGWPSDIPAPHPPIRSPGELSLDYMGHRHDSVYFVVQGWVHNDSDRVVRFSASGSGVGPIFYVGPNPVSDGEVIIPQKSNIEQEYTLPPRATALFEMRAIRSIYDLLHDGKDENKPYPQISRYHFRFTPGSVDVPELYVSIAVQAENPVRQQVGNKQWDAPIVVDDHCYVPVLVEREVAYPKKVDYVHAELQGDQDRLERMRQMDRIFEAAKRKEQNE